MTNSHGFDVAIAGGGIIGLSLALELRRRGLSVTVLERGRAMRCASGAAGGMLAVNDPQNPPKMMPLAVRSRELYPSYLDRIAALSGMPVPLRTSRTLQEPKPNRHDVEAATANEIAEIAPGLQPDGHRFEWLDEGSIDPRDLREALPAAFRAAGGLLQEETTVLGVEGMAGGVVVNTAQARISAGTFVNCCGAWAGGKQLGGMPVEPVKGQLANLYCSPERLRCVVRMPGLYLIPRGDGRVTIGATLEHVGFCETVQDDLIRSVIDAALRLLPEATASSPVEAWTGLRPGTPDGLPILGMANKQHCWHATGHYRDGILLAPATAQVMGQAMLGEVTDVSLDAFNPARFEKN